MREFEYDYVRVYDTCYRTAKVEHKGMTEEWYQKKAAEDVPKYMFAIFRGNLSHRIQQDGASAGIAREYAYDILEGLPRELWVNIHEYIDENPISDIKYGGVSIKDIMEHDKNDTGTILPFIFAAEAMMFYIENDCKDRNDCFDYFAKELKECEYDYDKMYETCYLIAKIENNEMIENWWQEKTDTELQNRMLRLFQAKLFHRIQQDTGSVSMAGRHTRNILERLPRELWGNVQEYIDEEPISDIKYGGVSIKDIIEYEKNVSGIILPFIRATEAMICYTKHGCEDKDCCFNYFSYLRGNEITPYRRR